MRFRHQLCLLGLVLPLAGCLSSSGKLGDDPAAFAEAERAAAFDGLLALNASANDAERRIAQRGLRDRFTRLALQLPNDADVRSALGALADSLGDRVGARRALDQALRLDPGHVAAAVLQAKLMAEDGDLDNARAVLDRARILRPREPELLLALAQVESLEGNSTLALAFLDEAESAGAEAWRVEYDRSIVHEFAGDEDAARAAYERALELAPSADRLPVR